MNRYARFADPYVGHAVSMDRRHARAIGVFLLNIEPKANVVEVGCCYGVSTSEVLDACEQAGFSCTLIDTVFQPSIAAMAREAAGRISLVMDAGHSVGVLADYVGKDTVVILDGDHHRAYMELESEILERQPPRAIVLHDVTSQRPDCDGPAWFLHRWQAAGYYVAIDYLPREGERTERGLAILCRDVADAEAATRAVCVEF